MLDIGLIALLPSSLTQLLHRAFDRLGELKPARTALHVHDMSTFQSEVADGQSNADITSRRPKAGQWKPTGHELMVMLTLSVVSLMVSLDATIIITSLSVCFEPLRLISITLTSH